MRNDHQDALRAGLAVGEDAPSGKSADEISRLWQWVAARLNSNFAHDETAGEATTFPTRLRRLPVKDRGATPASYRLLESDESSEFWDASL
jgi:hypothetical protein